VIAPGQGEVDASCLLKNQKKAGGSKMVRCKEAKKSRARSVLR
jgi:hypothetical protein